MYYTILYDIIICGVIMLIKVNILVFIILYFSGCSFLDEYYWECPEDINTIEEALLFVNNNTTYKSEHGDYWQFPHETYSLGTGDCEDIAGMLAHLLIYNVGLNDVKLIGCYRTKDRAPHMMVRGNGVYYATGSDVRVRENYKEIYTTVIELNYIDYLQLVRISHI